MLECPRLRSGDGRLGTGSPANVGASIGEMAALSSIDFGGGQTASAVADKMASLSSWMEVVDVDQPAPSQGKRSMKSQSQHGSRAKATQMASAEDMKKVQTAYDAASFTLRAARQQGRSLRQVPVHK